MISFFKKNSHAVSTCQVGFQNFGRLISIIATCNPFVYASHIEPAIFYSLPPSSVNVSFEAVLERAQYVCIYFRVL